MHYSSPFARLVTSDDSETLHTMAFTNSLIKEMLFCKHHDGVIEDDPTPRALEFYRERFGLKITDEEIQEASSRGTVIFFQECPTNQPPESEHIPYGKKASVDLVDRLISLEPENHFNVLLFVDGIPVFVPYERIAKRIESYLSVRDTGLEAPEPNLAVLSSQRFPHDLDDWKVSHLNDELGLEKWIVAAQANTVIVNGRETTVVFIKIDGISEREALERCKKMKGPLKQDLDTHDFELVIGGDNIAFDGKRIPFASQQRPAEGEIDRSR